MLQLEEHHHATHRPLTADFFVLDDPAPPVPSSSLDSTPSSVEIQPELAPDIKWRFRGKEREYALLTEALLLISDEVNAYWQFRDCGSYAKVVHSPSRRVYRLRASACGLRLCPHCGPRRRRDSAKALSESLGPIKPREWRFITLTLAQTRDPLPDRIRHLKDSFRRLRQTVLWKQHVRYGKAILEVTYNRATRCWHPHLHVVARGSYLSQSMLSAGWSAASGGSTIVDIRALHSPAMAVNYVAKYLGKSPDLSGGLDEASLLADYFLAMKNTKTIIRFGSWPPTVEREQPEDPDPGLDDWTDVGSLNSVIRRAKTGDNEAQRILDSLRSPENDRPQDCDYNPSQDEFFP